MKNYKLVSKAGETLFAGFFKDYKTCLEEAIVRHIPLNDINLKNQNLSNTNLDDGIMANADFTGCNLTGANLSECYLKCANFTASSLFNTCFAYSNLYDCNFKDASFGATDMTGTIIDNAIFSTLSAFTIDFSKTRQMHNCTFISNSGTMALLSTPPIVIYGLTKSPIIMCDDQIFAGHKRLDTKTSERLLQIIAKLHKDTKQKYVKIN